MEIESCFKVGFVLKPHGLKGEVTISIDREAPENWSAIDTVFLALGDRLVPYFIESLSVHGNKGFIKFEDIHSIEEASAVVRKSIYLPKSQRPSAESDGFYDDEILGFGVVDEQAGSLGNLVDIVQAGPNRLLVVDHDGKEVLIPVNSPFITNIDKMNRVIQVDLPEGFLTI